MQPAAFLEDLALIPESLERLAAAYDSGTLTWPIDNVPSRILLLGMGSSYFAASVIATRLRSLDVVAVAERASAIGGWPPSPDLLVIAISASGTSAETLAAVERHVGVSRVVALTNSPDSPVAGLADGIVDMVAGNEAGGVACRTYRHTIGALLALTGELTGAPLESDTIRLAAAASHDLLDRRALWLPEVDRLLDVADGAWFLAPVERVSSALQAALMVREGPRRRADGCETGDWSHVDVYLTKTLDYRAIVFAGSRFDAAAAQWMTARGAIAVSVSAGFPGSSFDVRYSHDDDVDVALLTEVLVAELLAATWWLRD